MTHLPEDLARALTEQPGLVRAYALEQALKYALAAAESLDSKAEHVARAHVTCTAEVSGAWSLLADALRIAV